MAHVCRVGDTASGTCYAHDTPVSFTGTWIETGNTLKIGGMSVISKEDTAPTSCGHTMKALGGSTNAVFSGKLIQRLGDAVEVIEGGSGTSTSGYPFVDIL